MALDIQEDALEDGYTIFPNVHYDVQEQLYYIACVTIIDGDIWVWDPTGDEPGNFSELDAWEKVK